MDSNLLQSNRTEVGSIAEQQLIYTFKSSDPSLQLHFQTMDILMIRSNWLYMFSYTKSRAQYANYLSTIERIVNSFETKTKWAPDVGPSICTVYWRTTHGLEYTNHSIVTLCYQKSWSYGRLK